jgi:hypothetical protein
VVAFRGQFFYFAPRDELCPPGAKLSPRGELCPLGVMLSPRGETLCSTIHFAKQYRDFIPGGEQRGEHFKFIPRVN